MRRERGKSAILVLYRVLLNLYPASFRERFGQEMLRDARRLLDSSEGRRVRAVGRLFRDLVRTLPSEWARKIRSTGSKEEHRGSRAWTAARGGSFLEGVAEDFRWAIRSLRRAPHFTVLTVTVLAVGLAGVTGVLSVVHAYLLRGLPYPHSERLMAVRPVPPLAWSETRDVFDPPVTWDLDAFTLVDGDRPELVEGAWVAPGYFEAFGIRPALGRVFGSREVGEGGASVAVISHSLWQQRYGGDPGILGRTVPVFSSDRPDDAEVFEIVGVLPEDFWFHHGYSNFLAPLRVDNPIYMGRLREGVSRSRAEEILAERARNASPDLPPGYEVTLTPFHDRYVADIRPLLVAVSVGVGLVMLIACLNGALLLLVRTTKRAQEIALRRALGAGRARVGRQLLLEGLLLVGSATVLGLLVAAWGMEVVGGALEGYLGTSAPGGTSNLGVDTSTTFAALGVALAVVGIFGLVPLLAPVHGALPGALAEGGRGTGEGRGHHRLRLALVAGELALSLALLIGAGLSIRSARHLAELDLGFQVRDRVKAQVNLRQRSYPTSQDLLRFYGRILAAAEDLPGVVRAAGVIRSPFAWQFGSGDALEAEGRPQRDPERAPRAVGMLVTPGYFETLGIPLLVGRALRHDDTERTAPVAVVSESLARVLWPGEDPLGKRLREIPTLQNRAHGAQEPGRWWRVVGVVGDVRVALDGPTAQYYVSYGQLTARSMSVVLHLRTGAPAPFASLERAVHRIDPTVALHAVSKLEEVTRRAGGPARFLAGVLMGFAAFAMVLAVTGLFGVISYAASRARREVAVRMALGASRGHVAGLLLKGGLATLALGLPPGILGGWLLARSLADELHGVSAWDPGTYAFLTLLMGMSALLASWLPALRAARSEPMSVLRDQ